ncbi:MAG: hypothetical protein IPL61_12805 [Myxococcales bacterium]|nr:hypothetical protein [Myxococcales bacterium]
MTTTTRGWVDAAIAVTDCRQRGPIFDVEGGAFDRERSYDNVLLRFDARGQRTCGAGGFELANVYAVLVDPDGAVIVRRSHDSYRQNVIGAIVTWAHELPDEHLARAAALIYEVETRVDLRRTLLAGTLGPVDLDREDRQQWSYTATEAPTDPLLHVSLSLAFRRGDIEVNVVGETALTHDGHSTSFEFDVLDEHGHVLASRTMSLSIRTADGLGFADTSMRLEKRVQRVMRGFALRGRTEVRGLTRVGPFRMDAWPGHRAAAPGLSVVKPPG